MRSLSSSNKNLFVNSFDISKLSKNSANKTLFQPSSNWIWALLLTKTSFVQNQLFFITPSSISHKSTPDSLCIVMFCGVFLILAILNKVTLKVYWSQLSIIVLTSLEILESILNLCSLFPLHFLQDVHSRYRISRAPFRWLHRVATWNNKWLFELFTLISLYAYLYV